MGHVIRQVCHHWINRPAEVNYSTPFIMVTELLDSIHISSQWWMIPRVDHCVCVSESSRFIILTPFPHFHLCAWTVGATLINPLSNCNASLSSRVLHVPRPKTSSRPWSSIQKRIRYSELSQIHCGPKPICLWKTTTCKPVSILLMLLLVVFPSPTAKKVQQLFEVLENSMWLTDLQPHYFIGRPL